MAIVEHLFPKDYYSKTLVASQADQRVLKDLLADKLPRLNAHFDAIGYDGGIRYCISNNALTLKFKT